MKNLLTSAAALVVALTLAGCKTTAPLSLTLGTATIVKYGLRNSPKTAGYLRDVQPTICAFANGEALTPNDLADLIDAIDTDDSKEGAEIVLGISLLYIAAYDSLGSNTNNTAVRPYAKAICDGTTIGLGSEPAMASRSRNAPPVVAKWRLLKKK